MNYDHVLRLAARRRAPPAKTEFAIHKLAARMPAPLVSIVLLDWSCRERFHSLDWLSRQDVARSSYELIWVELFDRVAPAALAKADTVITLGQRGMYHKHVGYNVGLLHARGEILTICDSDAVFPPDFVSSVLRSFRDSAGGGLKPLVLMHHELRSSFTYPDGLADTAKLADRERWKWWKLVPNAGACMSVRRADAIRFGGFDEHPSFRGYICGPYDLGWRLVNTGIPEVWHDLSTVLWHFAHPDPVGTNGLKSPVRLLLESTYAHVDMHALTAVEAFSTGRVHPLKESPEIHALRMASRKIGTPFEAKYADMTGPTGFCRRHVLRLRCLMALDVLSTAAWRKFAPTLAKAARRLLGERLYVRLRARLTPTSDSEPKIVEVYRQSNIIRFHGLYYGVPRSLGPVDFFDHRQRLHPEIRCGASRAEVRRLIRQAVRAA
jgi:hypothetical protein